MRFVFSKEITVSKTHRFEYQVRNLRANFILIYNICENENGNTHKLNLLKYSSYYARFVLLHLYF